MEDYNQIPKTGTIGGMVDNITANFQLTKEMLERIQLSKDNSRGLFTTAAALRDAYPSPEVGDWAIVGNTSPFDIYICSTAGTWVDSGNDYNGGEVNLSEYAKKTSVDSLASTVSSEASRLRTDEAWLQRVDNDNMTNGRQITALGSQLTDMKTVDDRQDSDIEGIKEDLRNLNPVVVEGNVTNNPDNVFLTSTNDEITPKERTTSLSAKGHYIMRPTDNFAAKLKANYIHEIPFDVDLGGASVTIPANAVLKFTGGRITNGTLTGNDTAIDSNEYLQCDLGGTFVAREGVIKSSNMANVLAHIKTPRFNVAEDVTIASGFATQTIADTTIDGQGHTLTIPSLSISTQGHNITIKDCTINTSETRVISVDAFCFGLVDSVGGSIAMLQNVGFGSLVGSVYLRGYDDAIIEDCSLVGATASAGSRKGAAILLDNQSVHVSGCTFSGLAKATHIMGGTSADKASEINNNTVTDCDGGFISNGGIVQNYSIIRNTLKDVGQTGGAEKANINIHGMDKRISIIDNSIIDFIGSPLDLDSSLSSAPNPNTNPHLLVSDNTIVGSQTYANLLIWQIKDVVFCNNVVKNLAKIVTRNCKNLTIKDNVLTADGFVESSYTIADTYNLYLIDNVLAMNPANAIAASVQFTADNTTVNAEFLRNTKYATGGKPFVYNTVSASSVRILKANTDWTSYTAFLPQTQPTTLDQFYTRADAYTKLSFNLSAAASESAFTFFVWLGIHVNNSAKIVTIAMQANGVPRLQSIYADNIVFKFYYEWDASTKIFDLYIIRGSQFLARGWLMLTVPNQGRNYDVPVTRSSTTVAIAETKTALTNASYIEMMGASELASASNNAISYSINEGFFAKAAGYVYNYLGLRANKLIGATADRPTGLGTAGKGYQFFDTTINLPIWWNGSAWVKSDGTTA